MSVANLVDLNALLNLTSAVLLTFGFMNIKRGRRETHRRFMLAAVVTSLLFLTSYVIYHYAVGSIPYPKHDWTRSVYFAVLIPHVLLAALMTPFIVLLLVRALRGQFERHKKIARFIWPVWMFVSVSGVVVYLMLYRL